MAYDEALAGRVRSLLQSRSDVSEQKMFGGLAFMVGGHMACGVLGPDLIVRIDPSEYDRDVAEPGARPWDFTGRPTRGMVYVGPDGTSTSADLDRWVARGLGFVATKPPKTT